MADSTVSRDRAPWALPPEDERSGFMIAALEQDPVELLGEALDAIAVLDEGQDEAALAIDLLVGLRHRLADDGGSQ